MTQIPQTAPGASYLAHKSDIDAAIQAALQSGWYILGEQVSHFEREFAEYLGVAHAVGVANGTDAIVLALRALGVGAGDLVYTVAHTAVATVTAVVNAGATPVLVDIDPATYGMSPAALETAIARTRGSGRPAAVLPVHIYGQPVDLDAIAAIATAAGMVVVEDCAQCHGAFHGERRAGSIGAAATFSFYPTKNLGAIGDGGAVVTGDPQTADALRALRQYGWGTTRYVSDSHGYNSRLDELQAAILRVKLRHLEADNARRAAIAAVYDGGLAGLTDPTLPARRPDTSHVFHQYVVRTPRRDALRDWLVAQGIGTGIHYPVPIHQQPAYTHLAPAGGLPNTEAAAREILSLPMYAELPTDDAHRVVEAIRRWPVAS